MPAEKIATCCYCGTRAALVLRGKDRHELTCSNCGAPLHDLKMLKAQHPGRRELVKPTKQKPYGHAHRDWERPKRKPKKRRKSLGRRFLEEAWDIVEDIID
ncbi:MAG: hypothetical protein AAFQ79_12785 [Pseudomonadota bacterium]